jgi:Leucine-rich repeat (LRR) protein
MSAEARFRWVVAKLKDLNPDFDATVSHAVSGGKITELGFSTAAVTDISPLRALTSLRRLTLGQSSTRGKLADLTPLKGLPLTHLDCNSTQVEDLAPLAGMPLKSLNCAGTRVRDLAPLRGAPMAELWCSHTPVGDLAPLRGMRLTQLSCHETAVRDLTPLRGMPLRTLRCEEAVALDPRNAAVLRSIPALRTINWLPAAQFWRQLPASH